MKDSAAYEKRFKALMARLRKAYGQPVSPEAPTDPLTELLWSILLEDSPEGTAKVAWSRLNSHFVDLNELRVSRADEIAGALPSTLGDSRLRAARMTGALQAVYDKFDVLDIGPLRDQAKRESRAFLASLPQMTPFVEGRVCLFSLGIHAMPVDHTLVDLLRERNAVHPDTDVRDTQGFLERVVPAKDAVETALLLEALRQAPEKAPAGKASATKEKRPARTAQPVPASGTRKAARKRG